MLEWDQLRYMLAIHRGGSMQAAALELRVDRATVLRRLDALETALGARLFERRRDGCTLTKAGLEIIETVRGIELAATSLSARVNGEDKRPEGVVNITVPEFFAAKILCPALLRLNELYPGIAIEISSGHTFLNLAGGEADIALRNRRPDHNSLVARRVGLVGIALYASEAYLEKHGNPRGNFAGHNMILFDESLRGMPGAAWIEEQLSRAHVLMRSNEILPLVAATRAGAGIGSLPVIAAHGEPGLVPLAPGLIGQPEIFLVTHRDLRSRARVRAVYDFIVRLCTERAAELSGAAIAEQLGDRVVRGLMRPASDPTPADLSADRPDSSPA
jgi:DNA-binding transcriptional LysR family regulator